MADVVAHICHILRVVSSREAGRAGAGSSARVLHTGVAESSRDHVVLYRVGVSLHKGRFWGSEWSVSEGVQAAAWWLPFGVVLLVSGLCTAAPGAGGLQYEPLQGGEACLYRGVSFGFIHRS